MCSQRFNTNEIYQLCIIKFLSLNQSKDKSFTTLIAQLDLGSTINRKKVLRIAETDQMADKPDG